MDEVIALTLRTMQQDMTRLERVGINLANVTTHGYKREMVVAKPFAETYAALQAAISTVQPNGSLVPSEPVQVLNDWRPGTLKSTGQSLDLALGGQGFFEVTTAQGPAYTRQGSFQVDGRGRLVTAQGHPVQGKSGEIYLSKTNPIIDAAGNIKEADLAGRVNETVIAQIKIVQFNDNAALQRAGDGLFSVSQNASQSIVNDPKIRQGFLENSNVNAMQEMLQMTQTMRHFETMQRVIQAHDDMVGVAIRKLGDL
jgi:flagellar basal-body rod protein FlgF